MKNLVTIILFSLSLTTFAQEQVLLNSKEVSVNSSEAILVRTSQTPKDVKVNFRVAMSNSVCERYETRMVLTYVTVQCGFTYRTERVPGRCIRTNPHNGVCLNFERETVRQIPVARYCREPRQIPQTYCAQHGTAVSGEMDSMKLTFKNLPALGGTETDTFLASAKQSSYGSGNVVWEMKALETIREYKISQRKVLGLFKTDGFKIEEK